MIVITSFFVYFSLFCYIMTTWLLFQNSLLLRQSVHNRSTAKYFIIILAVIYTYGAFGGDYPHYAEILSNLHHHKTNITHFEDLYVTLNTYLNGNYDLFRLCLAILSFVPLYWILKLTNRLDYRILFLYAVFEFPKAVEGRQQCAIYLFFLGLYILIKNHKALIGLILIITSWIFHKSGYICYALLPFVLFNFSKRNIFISILLFPLIVIFENNLLIHILNSPDNQFAGSSYLTAEAFSMTTAMKVIYYFRIALQYFLGIYLLKKFFLIYKRDKYLCIENISAKLLYGAIYISTLLFFIKIDQTTLFDRSLRIWWIPLLVLAGGIIKKRFINNKMILSISLITFLLSIAYILLIIRYQGNYYV